MIIRSGIDLVEINRLIELNPTIRERFIKRVFTPLEIEQCTDSNLSLCGRFAAKEAVAKALGCGIGPVSWQDIEISRNENGEPQLHLLGEAKKQADALKLKSWSISISHTDKMAVAIAVASE